MSEKLTLQLEEWGLSEAEAQVYVAVLRNGAVGAGGIAEATDIPRTSVYPIVDLLVKRGLLEASAGHGSRFMAVRPREALPSLLEQAREQLLARERTTQDLIKGLESIAKIAPTNADTDLIQVLRDPRVCSQRFQKLQLEARREIHVLVKQPIIARMRGNPAESKTLAKGVKVRAIYDTAALQDENIAPYLAGWIKAGEEAREYKGELPLKLVLFDDHIAWMPLETNGQRHLLVSILVRHQALAKALRLLFEQLWKDSKPIAVPSAKKTKSALGAARRNNHNADLARA